MASENQRPEFKHKFTVKALDGNSREVSDMNQATKLEINVDGNKTISISREDCDVLFHRLEKLSEIAKRRAGGNEPIAPIFVKMTQGTFWDDAVKNLKTKNPNAFSPPEAGGRPELHDENFRIALGAIYAAMEHRKYPEWNNPGFASGKTIGNEILPPHLLDASSPSASTPFPGSTTPAPAPFPSRAAPPAPAKGAGR